MRDTLYPGFPSFQWGSSVKNGRDAPCRSQFTALPILLGSGNVPAGRDERVKEIGLTWVFSKFIRHDIALIGKEYQQRSDARRQGISFGG